jgi:signal transduction histidine kinase
MRERVALVGGTLDVESAPGAGTTLAAYVPLARKAAADLSTSRAIS